MAQKLAERVGRGPCPHCAEPVTFKRSAGGMLRFSCDACQSSGYAEHGGHMHTKWAASIAGSPEPVPAPAAAPAAPAPKARAASSVFGLASL